MLAVPGDIGLMELIAYVKAAGGLAGPIFAVLFWLERSERKYAQAELTQVTEKSIRAMTELKAVVDQLSAIFQAGRTRR